MASFLAFAPGAAIAAAAPALAWLVTVSRCRSRRLVLACLTMVTLTALQPLLLLLLLTLAAAPTPGGVSIAPVFTRGEGGCSAFRIPGIASLNNTLLVFAECRKYGCADDEGQHNVVSKRSTDGGASFSAMHTLLDPMKMFPPSECPVDSASVRSLNHSCQFWDPTPIVDHQTGMVFLLTTRGWAHNGMTAVESRENSFGDMWVLNSSDAGISWSAPLNITDQVWSDTQHLPALNNGHGMQTSTGRLIMPACARPDAMVRQTHLLRHFVMPQGKLEKICVFRRTQCSTCTSTQP
jgi:Neuraminidase (sialidase)